MESAVDTTNNFLVAILHPQHSHELYFRIKHILVQTKAELHDALVKSHEGHVDCVVEVENRIVDNANFHRFYIQTSSFDYFGLHRVYMLILILQNYKHVHRPYCNHASGISSGRSIL
ncbi:hypothetical protein EE612_012027 [Oryza sativa]|nr:hypothetical protein EE612_012027 [Oryza sativa]